MPVGEGGRARRWRPGAAEEVRHHDRGLRGEGDELCAVAGEQTSAYGPVAERDAPAAAPELEPLAGDDDARQRAALGVDDVGARDLDGADAGDEVRGGRHGGHLALPEPGQACAGQQVVVQVAHRHRVHVACVEPVARGDPPDGGLRACDRVCDGDLVGGHPVAGATQPPAKLVDADGRVALGQHLGQRPLCAEVCGVEPGDLAVRGRRLAGRDRVRAELLEPYEGGAVGGAVGPADRRAGRRVATRGHGRPAEAARHGRAREDGGGDVGRVVVVRAKCVGHESGVLGVSRGLRGWVSVRSGDATTHTDRGGSSRQHAVRTHEGHSRTTRTGSRNPRLAMRTTTSTPAAARPSARRARCRG